MRQALNCGRSCGLASSTNTINNIVKFHLDSWGTGLMCWDSLSDAGRPSGDGASRFGMRCGLLGGQLLPGPRTVCRFVAVPDVLEDPDFEVPFLVIHAVKIYVKSVEGAQCLALPYGIVEMSENIQDFW